MCEQGLLSIVSHERLAQTNQSALRAWITTRAVRAVRALSRVAIGSPRCADRGDTVAWAAPRRIVKTCRWGSLGDLIFPSLVVGSFDELALLETGAGADKDDEVGWVDRAPCGPGRTRSA